MARFGKIGCFGAAVRRRMKFTDWGLATPQFLGRLIAWQLYHGSVHESETSSDCPIDGEFRPADLSTGSALTLAEASYTGLINHLRNRGA
jgi:hypothetical protein